MPPSKSDPRPNPLEGPGDYTTTSTIHNNTYAAISPLQLPATNKFVFISGASKGIGRATALSFARSGASKIAIGARSSLQSLVDELKSAAQEAGRAKPTILALQVDVVSSESVEAAARAVEQEFGGLDVLILNAGLFERGTMTEGDPDEWWKVWETNVRGPYNMIRAFLPLMLKTPGGGKTVVAVSSVGAHLVRSGLSAYQTSKLAVLR